MKKNFSYGQIVYSEGQIAKDLYFILNGDFIYRKTIKIHNVKNDFEKILEQYGIFQ